MGTGKVLRIIVTSLIIIYSSGLPINAENDTTNTIPFEKRNDIIKLMTVPIFPSLVFLSIEYEKYLDEQNTLHFTNEVYFTGEYYTLLLTFMPSYRHYFKSKIGILNNSYLSGFAKIQKFDVDQEAYRYRSYGGGIGILLGEQFILSNRLTFDLNFGISWSIQNMTRYVEYADASGNPRTVNENPGHRTFFLPRIGIHFGYRF